VYFSIVSHCSYRATHPSEYPCPLPFFHSFFVINARTKYSLMVSHRQYHFQYKSCRLRRPHGSPASLSYSISTVRLVKWLCWFSSTHTYLLFTVSETSATLLESRFSQFILSQSKRYFQ
jgi:hypothetical protein